MTRLQKQLIAVFIISTIGLSTLFFYGLFSASKPSDIPSNIIDKQAPSFEFYDLLRHKNFQLADFNGKLIIMNIWASWCLSCRSEAIILENFYQKHKDEDLVIIGIAVQDQEAAAIDFIKTYNKTYYLGLDSEFDDVLLDYGISGVPETFLIDKQGIIKKKFIGEVDTSALNEIWQYNN